MPLSNPEHIPVVLHYVQACQPLRILDVGIGTGSYGLLMRQSLDIGYGRVQRVEWQVQIHGVEIFDGYRNPVWNYAYDQVHMGDIRQLLPQLGTYDLVLCNDVLEHFPRNEAQDLVKKLLAKSKVLVATTPNRDYPQGAWGGNEAETHHCLLNRTDFPGLVAETVTGVTTCYVCTGQLQEVYPLLLAADRCVKITPPSPLNPFVRVRRKWREWRRKRQ